MARFLSYSGIICQFQDSQSPNLWEEVWERCKIVRELVRRLGWVCEVGLRESSVWSELVGCMAHRDFKVDRLVCCNQGSIHTGIVLNPAGPCAVRHGPYGVLDFRVAIGFPSLCQGCGLGRMLACLFFFRYFWSSATALGQRQFKEDLFLGSYGSESKVHLVGFETSAKFVGGRMLDHFPLQSNHESWGWRRWNN